MSAETVPSELTYAVPGMSCSNCEAAVTEEVARAAGVVAVEVDLDSKRVTIRGAGLDDASVTDAIAEAGYDAEP